MTGRTTREQRVKLLSRRVARQPARLRAVFGAGSSLRGRARHHDGSREDVAAAQFNDPEAAAGYADSHEGSGTAARFFRSRIELVSRTLASCPGGDLLDVGCGPGMMVRELLDSRPGDFRVIVLDQSSAMVQECLRRVGGADIVAARVGSVEALPFSDAGFDVVLAMGVLEYTEINAALAEIARVTRADGLVLVTMLNPLSLYRFTQWRIYWPLLRTLQAVRARRGAADSRPGLAATGIRAYRERTLHGLMTAAGLRPVDTVYFDPTFFMPRIDLLLRGRSPRWQKGSERAISRGWRKCLGSAYLVVARK